RLREARAALVRHRARVETARKEADFLRHAAEELEGLSPQAGEEEALAERRQLMMQAEKVASDLKEAFDTVAGNASPVPVLSAAVRRLERRAQQAPSLVEPSVAALYAALDALDEARSVLEEALRAAAFDPRELEQVEERLFALRAAARKYDVPVDELAPLRERFLADLAAIDAGEEELGRLATAVEEASAAYREAAARLSAGRAEAAARLEAAVNAELPPLKLERARFIARVESDDSVEAAEGFDRVEFWVQTNPGTRPG